MIGTAVRRISSLGYAVVKQHGHPRADPRGNILEHLLVAERALGKPLTADHPVHHVNEDGTDNRGGNLVICEDAAYHGLLHIRQRAVDACGHANWRKCKYCKRHDDPANLTIDGQAKAGVAFHRSCAAEDGVRRRAAKRSAAEW